jgi:DNA-binding CsgD family transcriptional regulator
LAVADGVVELTGGAAAGVAGSLVEAVAGRWRILSPGAVPVVAAAALLGAEFAVVDVATVLGRSVPQVAAPVAEAVAAGVLVQVGGRLGFAHPLILQGLYESIPAKERSGWHGRAAQALAAVGAAVDKVAQQLQAVSGPLDEWVFEWLHQHANNLTARAPQLAADLLQRAIDQLTPDEPRWEELATALVMVMRFLARHEDVASVSRLVLEHTTDSDCAGQLTCDLTKVLAILGRHEDALAVNAQMLSRRGDADRWTARIHAARAQVFSDFGRFGDAITSGEHALAEGEQVGDRYAVSSALHSLSQIAHRENCGKALALVDRALAVAGDDLESQHLRLALSASRTHYLRKLGRLAQSERDVQDLLTLADRLQHSTRRVSAGAFAAAFYYFLGRWDDALAELAVAHELLDEHMDTGNNYLVVHSLWALIAGRRNELATLKAHLIALQGLELNTAARRDNAEFLMMTRALAEEQSGDTARALGILMQVLEPDFTRDMADRQDCLPTLVRLAMAVGNVGVATAAVQACTGGAQRDPVLVKTAAARRCRGLFDGHADELRAAAEEYRAMQHLPDLAATLEDLAVVCANQGQTQSARAAYAEAIDLYVGLGALWDIRRAQERLAPYGIGGRRPFRIRPSTGWFALTPTEVKVAVRVARGLSNPDIAAELFLSRRTVQTHVSHILSKLEVRSRWEIAGVASGHPTAEADAEAV